MDFSAALGMIKRDVPVCRSGWNGRGMYLRLQTPDSNSKMTLPYIYLVTPHGPDEGKTIAGVHVVPWLASQTDILADDWQIAETPK